MASITELVEMAPTAKALILAAPDIVDRETLHVLCNVAFAAGRLALAAENLAEIITNNAISSAKREPAK